MTRRPLPLLPLLPLLLVGVLAAGCETLSPSAATAADDARAQDRALAMPPLALPVATGLQPRSVYADGQLSTLASTPTGHVRLFRGSEPLSPGTDATGTDAVVTGEDASVLLELPERARLYLEPQTEFLLPTQTLVRGTVLVDAAGTVRVRTGAMAVDAQGGPTRLVVTADAEGSGITVLAGTARVVSAGAAWPSRLVGAGERGLVQGSEPPRVTRLSGVEILSARDLVALREREHHAADAMPANDASPSADAAPEGGRQWFLDLHFLREAPDESGDIDFEISAADPRLGTTLIATPMNGAMLRGTPSQSSLKLQPGTVYQCTTRFGAECYFAVDLRDGEYVLRYGVVK